MDDWAHNWLAALHLPTLALSYCEMCQCIEEGKMINRGRESDWVCAIETTKCVNKHSVTPAPNKYVTNAHLIKNYFINQL